MKQLASEFKDFIMRGNVVDLAVAVVIGVAFGAVINALVNDIIMPIIGILGGKPNFDQYYWTINGSKILVGSFLTAVVAFLIIAAAIFFLVIKPLNMAANRFKKPATAAEATTRECPYCLSEIPAKATRCAHCTQEVPALVTTA
ncbi:MAG: Large-conductance mechanosensitive channel [Ktedonobacterales bacterium]|jgi:large conductance mechanosensitive channel|nr:MAG: Large-conductance mechanosensitive channel [Ktedonobacterales bacterium]